MRAESRPAQNIERCVSQWIEQGIALFPERVDAIASICCADSVATFEITLRSATHSEVECNTFRELAQHTTKLVEYAQATASQCLADRVDTLENGLRRTLQLRLEGFSRSSNLRYTASKLKSCSRSIARTQRSHCLICWRTSVCTTIFCMPAFASSLM